MYIKLAAGAKISRYNSSPWSRVITYHYCIIMISEAVSFLVDLIMLQLPIMLCILMILANMLISGNYHSVFLLRVFLKQEKHQDLILS